MSEGVSALSEREKETLRLLLGGHDAKSIARHLGLSVHTINERLRDARRKLHVSSSREAARLLAEAETGAPHSFVDKQFGVASVSAGNKDERPNRRHRGGHSPAWIIGGMLIMSLVVAAVVFSSMYAGGSAAPVQVPSKQIANSAAATPSEPAEATLAREWLQLLDRGDWKQSWNAAGTVFQSQLSEERWASTIQSVRQPLGPVSSRAFQTATKTNSLPGAPTGEYDVVQFHTSFSHKADAIETVVLTHESSGWKVNGYFIR